MEKLSFFWHISMVDSTKVLCPENLFSRKLQRYKGRMLCGHMTFVHPTSSLIYWQNHNNSSCKQNVTFCPITGNVNFVISTSIVDCMERSLWNDVLCVVEWDINVGGDPVLDTDSGSLFRFRHHCRIGDFRRLEFLIQLPANFITYEL